MIVLKLRNFYKEHAFTPHNILKNTNCSSGALICQGIEMLRVVKCDFFSGGKYFNCIFQTKNVIRHGNKVENTARQLHY